nr:hypothetical protein [Tanacetum cinerariifolium]
MMKGAFVWSVRYLVNIEQLMNPLPEGWSIRTSVWSICLEEGKEDAFLVMNLSGKVVKYNLISKTNTEIFDIGSNQMDDDVDDVVVFIPPFEVHPNLYEFISSLANMDLFNFIRASNPMKVKIRSRPRAAHEVPLLTMTANRVIKMEDLAAATDSSGVPSTIERSPLDFFNEARASDQGTVAPEVPLPEDVPATSAPDVGHTEEVAATNPSAITEKRGRDGADANAPPKVLRMDHADP